MPLGDDTPRQNPAPRAEALRSALSEVAKDPSLSDLPPAMALQRLQRALIRACARLLAERLDVSISPAWDAADVALDRRACQTLRRVVWQAIEATRPEDRVHVPGHLYERALGWRLTRAGTPRACLDAGQRRKNQGAHYTPPQAARWLAAHALSPACLRRGALPSHLAQAPREAAARSWSDVDVFEWPWRTPDEVAQVRICDPAVGGGALLIEAGRCLTRAWLAAQGASSGVESRRRAWRTIVGEALHGVDLDPLALELAQAQCQILAGSLGEPIGASWVEGDAVRGGPWRSQMKGRGEGLGWGAAFPEVFRADGGRPPGFDVLLCNPPYLSGARRPGWSPADYELAQGAWDVSWLFVEQASAITTPGASQGWILPDAVLARESTQPVRRWLLRSRHLTIRHEGAIFAASVGAMLCCGHQRPGARQMHFERLLPDGGVWRVARPLGRDLLHESARWPPALDDVDERLGPALGEFVSIARGEELGKSSLERWSSAAACDDGSMVGVLTGGALREPHAQPLPTHVLSRERVRKPAERYRSPKLVIAKTGRRLTVAVDRRHHVALQSVYMLHLKADAPPWLTPWMLSALLNSEAVHQRFIAPWTDAKRVFPQITQRMLRDIRLPALERLQAHVADFSGARRGEVTAGLEALIESLYVRAR